MQLNTISTLARRRDSRHGTALLPAAAWQGAPLVWRLGVLRADGSLDDLAGIAGIGLRITSMGGTRPGETRWLDKTVDAADFRTPASAAAVAAGTDWHAEWGLTAEETMLPVEATGTRVYWYEFRAADSTVLAAGQLVLRSGAGSDGAFLRGADAEQRFATVEQMDAAAGQLAFLGQVPMDIIALQVQATAAADGIGMLQQSQTNGHKGYATLTALAGDLSPPEGMLAEVTNDPDPDRNGVYRKSGGTGTGSWIKSADGIYGDVDTLKTNTGPLALSTAPLSLADGRLLLLSFRDGAGRVAAGLVSTGEWISVHGHDAATSSQSGFMSAAQAQTLEPLNLEADIYSPAGRWVFAIRDSAGRVAAGLTEDGVLRAARAVIDALPGTLTVDGLSVGGSGLTVRTDVPGWAMVMPDSTGRIGFGIREDGTALLPGLAITAGMLVADSVSAAKLDLTLRRETANDYAPAQPDFVRGQAATVGVWYNNRWQQLPAVATPVLWGLNDSGNTLDIRPSTGLMIRGRRRINSFNPGAAGSVTYKGDLTSSSTWPPAGSFVTGDYYSYVSTPANRTIGSDTVRLGDLMVWNGSAWIYQPAPGSGAARLEQDWWDISADGTFDGVTYVTGDRILYLGFQSNAGTGWERWHKGNTAAGEFYRNGTFAPSGGLPASPVDGEIYEASAAGTAGGFTFAIGDSAFRWGGAWGKITSGPIQNYGIGALIHLPCKASASEWEVRRADGGTALIGLTLNSLGRPVPRRSNNAVEVLGDSMADGPGTALAALLPDRTVTTRSYGGGTASNILSAAAFVIGEMGDPDAGKTLVTFVGQNSNGFRAQNFFVRQRLAELAGAADRRVLHVSMLGQRVLTWNGTRLVCANFEEQRVAGSTNSYARDVATLRTTWPGQWLWAAQNLCDAAATDTEPSIQWPGMTNAQVAAAYGIPPLKWCRSINLTGVVLGSLNYLGAHSAAGLPTGGSSQDYYLRTGNGTVGNPIVKIAGVWTEITFDAIHLNTAGDTVQAAGVAAMLAAKNW